MSKIDEFEAHIKSTAWYRVLSEAAKDDDEGQSIFRMARMAASVAWQAARAAALEEAAVECDQIAESQGGDAGCANAIRALAKGEGE